MKVDVAALAARGKSAAALLVLTPGIAAGAGLDYVQLAVPSPIEAVKWYAEHMECEPSVEQADAADCHGVEIVFGVASTLGGTPGTGVNHIGFSFPDLEAKMSELEAVGCPRRGGPAAEVRGRLDVSRCPGPVQARIHIRPMGDADRTRRGSRPSRISPYSPELG